MTTLHFQNSTFGWEGIAVPDNLTVRMTTPAGDRDVYLSVQDLFLLYGFLVERVDVETVLGTNLYVDLRPEDNSVVYRCNAATVEMSVEQSQEELRALLRDVFRHLTDESDPPEEVFQDTKRFLRSREVEVNPKDLYVELTD